MKPYNKFNLKNIKIVEEDERRIKGKDFDHPRAPKDRKKKKYKKVNDKSDKFPYSVHGEEPSKKKMKNKK